MKTISIFCLVVAFACCLTITCNSFAWTNYVSAAGSDTAPYDTWAKAAHSIQDAVDYAVEGNVVLVDDGNYTVASQIMIITNNIILKSANGAANVSIDGNSTSHPIYLRGNSIIDGFSIINGNFFNGGGIFVQNYGTILNCIFTNNLATDSGGAIYARDCLVSNCYFYANGAEKGGGVFMKKHSSVKDCIFESNFSTNGGAVYCYDPNSGDLSDCVISNNNARIGGGIYVDNNASTALTNTFVEFNHASDYGGGIAVNGGSFNVAQNCYIKDNIAANMGGGIYADNADVFITGTNTYLGIFYWFAGANQCLNGDGGGVYAIDSDIVLSGAQCTAGYNYSVRDGGAFYITNSSLSLLDGSQIIAGWGSRNGGGIFAMDSEIVMDNAKVTYCAATNGGGIFAISSTGTFNNSEIVYNNANENVGAGGGIFVSYTGAYSFTDSVIANNNAHDGGGIFAYLTSGDFFLNNTDVISNRVYGANSFAGGIYWFSDASLEAVNGCRLSHNLADDNIGGAYFMEPGIFSFNDTEISYNIASNHVGGIAVVNSGQIKCTDCSINNNVADADTNGVGNIGAIYVNNASVDLISLNGTSTVTNNSGVDGGAAYALSGGKLSVYGDVLFADNRASQYGGGIYATNLSTVSLLPTNGASPSFVHNFAKHSGGGMAAITECEVTAVNIDFEGNICSNLGGAIYAALNSKVNIKGDFSNVTSMPPNTFLNNHSRLMGGAIIANIETELNISDTAFISNSAGYATGGIIASMLCTAQFENVIFAHNSSPELASAFVGSANNYVSFNNCTIANNISNAIWNISGQPVEMENCIVWGNQGVTVLSSCTAQFSNIQGGLPGFGNITNDPMFVDSDMLDYQLIPGSDCIDSGVTIASITNDCIGNPRPLGLGYDMGAYELRLFSLLNVIPLELDFGDVIVGNDSDLSASIENLGNAPLNGTIINVMNPIFSVQTTLPYSVNPFSSNVVTFRFSPLAEIPITNIVTFLSNGGSTNALLIGTGIPEPGFYLLFIIYQLLLINYWRKLNL